MTEPTGAVARPAIGLSLPTWPLAGGRNATWPEIRAVARDAEALGVDTLWVPDHLQRRVPALGDQEAIMVAEALGDLPLAIEQAGAWLAETGTPAAEYVEQLTRQSAAVLALSQPSDYPTPVAVTWQPVPQPSPADTTTDSPPPVPSTPPSPSDPPS